MKTIYIGNLPLSASEDNLRELFTPYGDVSTVTLIKDLETDQPRGFGFVEMPEEAADKAVEALDGVEYDGRTLRINEARNRGAAPPRRSW